MTRRDPQEPERWLVSGDAPADLRALLEVARREGPSIAERASLGMRLGLSARQALIGVGTKGFAAATIVLAAAAGAGLGLSAGHQTHASVPAEVARPEAVAAIPLAPASEQSAPLPAPPPPEPPAADSAPPPPTVAKPPSEASLIRSAHDALGTSVRQARGYLERHRRLYPDGQLAQEREVLLIEVLRLEGHPAEASARAAEFRQKNPDSAHRPALP